MNLPETVKLQEIYGETEVSGARFKNLADHFEENLTRAGLRPPSSIRSVSAQVSIQSLSLPLPLPENHYKYFFLQSVRSPVCTKLKQVS